MNPTIAYKHTLGPLRWTVPSATQPGITYEVAADIVTGELRCNCPAIKTCWHIKAVAAGALGKPRVRCTTRPAHDPLRVIASPAMQDFADALQL